MGVRDGESDGTFVVGGRVVGCSVGVIVGNGEGTSVGGSVGASVGVRVGDGEGTSVGVSVGLWLGMAVGYLVGDLDRGTAVGFCVRCGP